MINKDAIIKNKHKDYSCYYGAGNLINFCGYHETGVSIVDDQHRGLVGTINTLFHYMRKSHGGSIAQPIIVTFRNYTGVHYYTEKSLLAFADEAEEDQYDQEFEDLHQQLFRVETLFRRSKSPDELLDYLKNWWLRHMEGHAKYFIPYNPTEDLTN